jgi:hypothetical protein
MTSTSRASATFPHVEFGAAVRVRGAPRPLHPTRDLGVQRIVAARAARLHRAVVRVQHHQRVRPEPASLRMHALSVTARLPLISGFLPLVVARYERHRL